MACELLNWGAGTAEGRRDPTRDDRTVATAGPLEERQMPQQGVVEGRMREEVIKIKAGARKEFQGKKNQKGK